MCQLKVDPLRRGRGADRAGGRLDVLLGDGVRDVAGRQPVLGHLLRVEPDAHRIVASAKDLDLAHALDACRRSLMLSGHNCADR